MIPSRWCALGPILCPIKSTEQSVRVGCHATSYSRRRVGRFVRTGTSARHGVILPGRRFPARRPAHTTYRHKYFSPAAGARGPSKLYNLRADRNEAHRNAHTRRRRVCLRNIRFTRAGTKRTTGRVAPRAFDVDCGERCYGPVYGGLYTSREYGLDAVGLREIRDARTTIVPVGGVARSDAARRGTARPARRFSAAARHYLSRPPQARKAATLCRPSRSQPESRYSRPDIILLYLRSERGG